MTSRHRLVALIATAMLAGCSTSGEPAPRVVQPGAPGEDTQVLSADEVPSLDALDHSEADVRFLHGMIPHHLQALQMTALVPERTARDDVLLLAERMDVSQGDEVEQMQRWLRERGEEVPDSGAHHHHGELMPGMLSEQELAQLEAAVGAEFDRLFLEFMIRHHEGGLLMVEELFATEDGGIEPEINQIATHIDSDQRIEISRMLGILAELQASAAG